MRLIALSLLLSLAFTTLMVGQAPFMTTYKAPTATNVCWSLTQLPDSGFIMVGFIGAFAGADVQLIRTDKKGDTVWTRTYGGTALDVCTDVIAVSSGGYALIGRTASYGAGGNDAYLLRVGSSGTLLWSKTYGGTGFDLGWDIIETSDGGFMISGFTYSFGAGKADGYLIKTLSDGTIDWIKTYGGPENEVLTTVIETFDGGYLLAGYTNSFGAGSNDVLVIKIEDDGDTTWVKTIGGAGSDLAWNAIQLADSSYAIVGETFTFGVANKEVYLIRVTANGNLDWSVAFGGSGFDSSYDIVELSDGSLVLGCETSSSGAGGFDAYLIKTTATGSKSWSMTYGGVANDNVRGLVKTMSGGFALAAYSLSFGDGMSFYLINTNDKGETGLCYEEPASDTVSLANSLMGRAPIRVLLGGSSSGPNSITEKLGTGLLYLNMDGTPFIIPPSAPGNSDGSVTVIVSGGAPPYSYLWDDSLSQTTQIATGLSTGTYKCVITDQSGCSITVEVYLQPGTGIEDHSYGLSIYPNPGTGYFTLDLTPELGKLSYVNIYSIDGSLILQKVPNGNSLTSFDIDLTNAEKGIYFLQAVTADKVITGKLVVQ